MRTPRPLTLVLVGLWCSLFATAGAQGPPRSGGARTGGLTRGTRALLDQGIAALAAHDLPAAMRLLTDAYRQSQRSEVLYQLGRLAAAESRPLDAYDLMRRYLADPSRTPDEAATRAAEAIVNQPPPPSGSLSVLSDAGALVWVDSRLVATLPLLLPLLVAPGAHTVKLEFPGQNIEAPVLAEQMRLTELRMNRASRAVLVSVMPAILSVVDASGLPEDASQKLADAMEQAARDEQYTLLPTEQLLSAGDELQRCRRTESCQRELATKQKLELVLEEIVQVQGAAPSPTWKLELRLLRLGIAEPAAREASTCEACTAAQAAAQLKQAAAKLLSAGLYRTRGTLHLTAEPAAATVHLGERALGPLPFSETLWAGSYELRASHPGYQPAQQTVEIRDGQPSELQLTLAPTPEVVARPVPPVPPPTPRGPRPRWRLAVGGALLGVGLTMTIVGAIGVGLDNSCAVSPINPNEPCPKLYDTLVPGGATLGGGLLFLGAGAVVTALPGPRR